MAHIALIPARAGSKSISNKNLRKIGPKSLVEHAVDSALGSKLFSRVYLSTDMPVLIDQYQSHPLVRTLARPENLCTDKAPMQDVVKHFAQIVTLADEDYIWLLQPSSPFRQDKDYKRITRLINWCKASSVISVTDMGAHHPSRAYTLFKGKIRPLNKFTNFKNKQDLKPIYIRNGAYYVAKVEGLRKAGLFNQEPCYGYVMGRNRSVNIDSKLDLLVAQQIIKNRMLDDE